jgi:hypothetical protein
MHSILRRRITLAGRSCEVSIHILGVRADGIHVGVPTCYDGEHVHPPTYPMGVDGCGRHAPGYDADAIADLEAARLQALADAGLNLWEG